MRLRSAPVATERGPDDDPDARVIAGGGARGGPLDGRRSWTVSGRGQGPAPPAHIGDDDGGRDHTTRLIEALATVLGRRLDVIETRLDELSAPAISGAPQGGAAIGARLDRLDRRLEELLSTAGRDTGAGASAGGTDRALRQVLARLDSIESRLGADRAPEAATEGALARVEARLDQLNRLLLG